MPSTSTAGPDLPRVGLPVVGAMGAAIGARLRDAGHDVSCCVEDRSAQTRARARRAGLRCVASIAELVRETDVVLCIAPSQLAPGIAEAVAAAASSEGARLLYVDANPLATGTLNAIRQRLGAGGIDVVDASLIGLPPVDGRRPTLLVATHDPAPLGFLDQVAVNLRHVGPRFGDASRLKLLQISVSKVTNAGLGLSLLAAQRADLYEEFTDLLAAANPDLLDRALRSVPWMPVDAGRFETELAEVKDLFSDLGVPTGYADAASEVLTAMRRTAYANETRETRDPGLTTPAVLAAMDGSLARTDGNAPPDFVLTLMTDNLAEARQAASAGVNRIGPDLEILGKSERQPAMGTRVSIHRPEAVAELARCALSAEVFARVDPIHAGSARQIDRLISDGVTSLMLPYFHTSEEVEAFVRLVGARARTTLLVETAASLFRLPDILAVAGVNEIHFGLTDLMLSTGVGSRYEILMSDLFQHACDQVLRAGKPLHIGGVASIDDTSLPLSADLTLARYVELGASGALLTRAFMATCETEADLDTALARLRGRIDHWRACPRNERDAAVAELRATVRAALKSGKWIP